MLSYDYVEYQHIKLHLFSTTQETDWYYLLPRLFTHTVLHYADRVLDMMVDTVSDRIGAYLYTTYVHPRTERNYETYFRTRFHLLDQTSSAPDMILNDTALYRLLQGIPREHKDNERWLSALLYPCTPNKFRNNPVRHILAYRGHSTIDQMHYMNRFFDKLNAYHYHASTDINTITLPLSKHPEYLSFDNHTVVSVSTHAPPRLHMDEFVFETEAVDVTDVTEMEEDTASAHAPDVDADADADAVKPTPNAQARCGVTIRNGFRKGSVCNRICKQHTTTCGIHQYVQDQNQH